MEVDDLKAVAAAFDELLGRDRAAGSHDALDGDPQLAAIAELLAAGDSRAALDRIDRLAASSGELPARIYQAAARAAIERPEIASMMTGLEGNIDPETEDDSQSAQEEDLSLQAVGAALLPIAGLDLPATFHYTKVFMDNFPSFSLPLGDYDLRATRWIAQLMDMGEIRAAYRQRMRDLADVAAGYAPQASARVSAWAADPPPSDPTQDWPWTQGLLALVRSAL